MPAIFRYCIMIQVLFLAALAQPAFGFFQDATDGARPAGMGEAFVAVADDANTVLFNPAGFARIHCLEMLGMYSDLYSGLNPALYNGNTDRLGYNFISLAVPVSEEIGHFGLAWVQLQTDFYQENTLTLSYARRVWNPLKLDLGLNAKMLSWNIRNNDFTGEASRARLTMDAGALCTPCDHFQVGIGFDNIIPADMGLDETELAPWNFRIGGAYLFPISIGASESIQAQLELDTRDAAYDQGNANLKLGVEALFFSRLLAVRTGINRDVYTCGLGLKYQLPGQPLTLQMDYAFSFPFELKYNNGSHRIGLTVRNCQRVLKSPAPVPAFTATAAPTPDATPEPVPTPRAEILLEQKLQEVQKKIEVGELKPIFFDLNNDTIKPESFATLDYLGGILEKYPALRVQIEGHTDSQGDAEYNKTLSQARVESAQKYLTARFKIAPQNLVPVGFGKERPIADNVTPEGRAKNRRVEFHVIGQGEGQPAPGGIVPEAQGTTLSGTAP